jgi:Pyridoxamine 5'-phosphate oxidase
MRSTAQRRADALEKLENDQDVWVATAAGSDAYLVPLSLCWLDGQVVVTTPAQSPTARNAAASGQARLALGDTRDVVMIDASVASVVPQPDANPALVEAFRNRAGWAPDGAEGNYVYLRFQPRRIQVWRNVEELSGRTVMRDGTWLS